MTLTFKERVLVELRVSRFGYVVVAQVDGRSGYFCRLCRNRTLGKKNGYGHFIVRNIAPAVGYLRACGVCYNRYMCGDSEFYRTFMHGRLSYPLSSVPVEVPDDWNIGSRDGGWAHA